MNEPEYQSAAFTDARVVTMMLLTLFAASACSDYDSVRPPSSEPTALTVTLAAPVIEVGQVTFATVAGVDQYGDTIPTGAVTWTSSALDVATVDSTTGSILGVALGTARITATADGQRTASQIITVISAPAITAGTGAPTRGSTSVGDTPITSRTHVTDHLARE